MKKIAIDITHFDRLSGYGVVTRNIVKWLLKKDTTNFYYLFANKDFDLNSLNEFKNFEFIKIPDWFIKYKFFSLAKYLKEYKIDVFLSLDQDLPLIKTCKYICISHDIWAQIKWKINILKQLLSLWTDKLDRIYHLLDLEKISLKKADLVFTPSLNTKNDVISHYKISENKIILNYWWIDHLKEKNNYEKENYILFPYSNLYSNFQYKLANKLIETWIINKVLFLRPAYIDNNFILNKNIEIIQCPILPENNEKYYKKAVLSVYLSDYDWFWFVPLESMFYWTPVIYNQHSCMEEITSNWWIWIKKLDLDDFYQKIKEIIENKKMYESIKWKGYNNLARFKWENTVNKILTTLNNIKLK